MKRKALAVVLIAIIALALASWFVYNQFSALQNQMNKLQTQNSELQDQNADLQEQIGELQDILAELQNKLDVARDVKITGFKWLGGFIPVVGLFLSCPIEVTVGNTGVNNVSGLNLTVRLVYVGTETEVAGHPYVAQIDVIHAGETLKFSGDIWAGYGLFSADSAVCVIRLSLADIVLDEWTRPLKPVS